MEKLWCVKEKELVPQEFINLIVKKLVEVISPIKIILFGSYAYGKPDANSDIDIFVVMDSTEKPVKRRIALSNLFIDRLYPLDFIVYNPAEVTQRLKINDPFISAILNKGKILYDKNS